MYDLHVKPDYKYIKIPHECIIKTLKRSKLRIQ